MPVGLSSNTGQPSKSESVAISVSYSGLSTTCWPRSLETIGIVLAESHQPVVLSYLRKCAEVYDRGCLSTGHCCFPKATARISASRAGVGFHRPPLTTNRL